MRWLVPGLLVLLLLPNAARADGMAYITKSAASAGADTADILPEAQRALFRYVPDDPLGHAGTWELTIQPRFARPATGAVWVVPFPQCPTVTEGDPVLLNDLDFISAPVFVEGCQQTCGCSEDEGFAFCAANMTKDGGANVARGFDHVADPRPVSVWQTGAIGALDFVVLSAADGEDLTAWLEENDYVVAPALQEYATAPENAGACYFAARLSEPVADETSLPAVTFELVDFDQVIYPMRLTGTGLPEGAPPLGLELFILTPRETLLGLPCRSLAVSSQVAPASACRDLGDASAQSYQECMNLFFADHTPGTLAIGYDADLTPRITGAIDRVALCDAEFIEIGEYLGSGAYCLPLQDLFDKIPDFWSDGFKDLATGSYHLFRLAGTFTPQAMAQDIVLQVGPPQGYWLTSCEADTDCAGEYKQYDEGSHSGVFYDHGCCLDIQESSRCTVYCSTQADCPTGWTCQGIDPLDHKSGMPDRACMPPAADLLPSATPGVPVSEPFTAAFAHVTFDCGYDCDDVCDGNVEGGWTVATVAPCEVTVVPSAWGFLLALLALLVALRIPRWLAGRRS